MKRTFHRKRIIIYYSFIKSEKGIPLHIDPWGKIVYNDCLVLLHHLEYTDIDRH